MITEVKKNKTEIKSFLEEVKKVNNRDFRIIRRKIEKEKDHEIVYVISFHEADKDELMNRPYKEEK